MNTPIPRIQTILDAIKARLEPEEVLVHAGAPRDNNRNEAPPRVVLAPMRGRGAAGVAGALYTREVTMEVACWGETVGVCEELQVLVINAARSVAAAMAELGDERWYLGGVNDRGVEMKFDMTFQIPIERRTRSTPFLPLNPRTTVLVTDPPLNP